MSWFVVDEEMETCQIARVSFVYSFGQPVKSPITTSHYTFAVVSYLNPLSQWLQVPKWPTSISRQVMPMPRRRSLTTKRSKYQIFIPSSRSCRAVGEPLLTVSFWQAGNPKGKPGECVSFDNTDISSLCVSCCLEDAQWDAEPDISHGGPGSGTSLSRDSLYFNPEVYRIVLVDQRGAGESEP